jgi:subtilisin-like proprotein convertase family protein
MRRRLRFFAAISLLLALAAGGLLISSLFRAASAQQNGAQLSAEAQRQIKALLNEKKSRSSAEKKLDSQLLYAMKARRGEPLTAGGEVRSLRTAEGIVKTDAQDRVLVDIKGYPAKEVIETIGKIGGEVVYANLRAGSVRARIPFDSLEAIAGVPAVKSVRPPAMPKTQRQLEGTRGARLNPTASPSRVSRSSPAGLTPDFRQRAMNIRTQLSSALTRAGAATLNGSAVTRGLQGPVANAGTVTSQGDTAHRVADGRNFFGNTGAGVKIGVLSDSVDFLAQSIASGDLPPDVTVLPGQSGVPGIGEGTAMLEIIHDLAPGAKLFFATAFISVDSFADNIRALRAAGCDIIVDDVIWSSESPFHDDTISTAVEEVVADGALYFSSAGNYGNFNDGTSSVWEGDFKNSRTTLPSLPGGTLHDFGNGVISNRVESFSTFVLGLWWSDPLGASDNDYDIFIMDNALTTVLAASTNVQDGDDDPIEITFGAPAGTRVIIFKAEEAQRRALHLNNFAGQLGISTAGATHGHAAAAGGFGVAAIDVAAAGGGAFTGGPTNPVELFSGDGFRRVFFKSDGSPFTPGNLLFSNNGGDLRKKPDLTAADGVATSVPNFPLFFGTSASAPHAAAIAALLKSAKPRLAPNRIRQALTRTALDIEANGFDRDSGAGIIDAFAALQFIGAAPSPFLEAGAVAVTPVGGDGDNFIEPGEGGTLTATLTNIGGATALNVSATLTTSTPGVTITTASSSYPNIGSNGQSEVNNIPFAFTIAPTAICGLRVDFTLTVSYANSNEGPQVFTISHQTAPPETGTTAATVSYTGPPVPIPSNSAGTITIPIVVSGLSGAVGDLNFSFDGSSCTADIGATTVGLDHTWVGDLIITLTSPQGTTVTLMNQPGGPGNGANNFCNTVLDDGATALIQNIQLAGAPWTGAFKPATPLAAFNGEIANGTWTLSVTDVFPADGGNVRAFSLAFSTFVCSGP